MTALHDSQLDRLTANLKAVRTRNPHHDRRDADLPYVVGGVIAFVVVVGLLAAWLVGAL